MFVYYHLSFAIWKKECSFHGTLSFDNSSVNHWMFQKHVHKKTCNFLKLIKTIKIQLNQQKSAKSVFFI